MAENWHSLVYFLVEKFCFINRQIDAAVAAGILVDGSAEFTSPACVMETDAAVEWHPIVYVTSYSYVPSARLAPRRTRSACL